MSVPACLVFYRAGALAWWKGTTIKQSPSESICLLAGSRWFGILHRKLIFHFKWPDPDHSDISVGLVFWRMHLAPVFMYDLLDLNNGPTSVLRLSPSRPGIICILSMIVCWQWFWTCIDFRKHCMFFSASLTERIQQCLEHSIWIAVLSISIAVLSS